MCKIIQFPVKKSNGFLNLASLFEICDTLETCNFYLESADQLFKDGSITENELYTLRRIGRQKRLELTAPAPQKPQEAAKPGTYTLPRNRARAARNAKWKLPGHITESTCILIRL